MEMQASRALPASQQQAWDALNDPEMLKLCIPGCDKLEATGEGQYTVGMALKIGPVSAKFSGKLALSDIVPPTSYQLAFDGQGGVAGFGKGQAQVRLEAVAAEQLRRRHPRAEPPADTEPTDAEAREGAATVLLDSRPGADASARAGAAPSGGVPVWVWGAIAAALVAVAMYLS